MEIVLWIAIYGVYVKYKVCLLTLNRTSQRKRDKKAGIKKVLGEIMAENFPNVKKEIDIRVQEI